MKSLVHCSVALSLLALSCGKKEETASATKAYTGTLGNCKQTYKSVAPGSGLCTDWTYSGQLASDPAAELLPTVKATCATDATYTAVWTDTKTCDSSAARAKCVLVNTAKQGAESFSFTGTIYLVGDIFADKAAFDLVKATCQNRDGVTATWTEIKAPLSALALDGTWKSACSLVDGSYQKSTIVFEASSFTKTIESFDQDATCATANLNFSTTAKGTYWSEGEVATPSGFRKLNYVYSDVTLTPATAAVATTLNGGQYYTFSDWAAGTAKSIAGKLPQTTSPAKEKVSAAGEVGYDIAKVENGVLSLGKETDELDGSSDAKRPAAADSVTFTKQ